MHVCFHVDMYSGRATIDVAHSVRYSAAATGETLWGRLPCNPTLTIRPVPLSEPNLTALNCYL